jgi:hypothetical protein
MGIAALVVGSSRPRRVVLLVDVPLSKQVALPFVLDGVRWLGRTASRGSGTERDDFAHRRALLSASRCGTSPLTPFRPCPMRALLAGQSAT